MYNKKYNYEVKLLFYRINLFVNILSIFRNIFVDDSTRFVLKDRENDYVNANYINMEIPGSGIINRYIATQGKLCIHCK